MWHIWLIYLRDVPDMRVDISMFAVQATSPKPDAHYVLHSWAKSPLNLLVVAWQIAADQAQKNLPTQVYGQVGIEEHCWGV